MWTVSPPAKSYVIGESTGDIGIRRLAVQNGHAGPAGANFSRTLRGLEGIAPHLTCENASIHTLKRNSTTSPSAMT
jgi:hypothetical protein